MYTNIRSVLPKTVPLSSLIDSCSASIVALTETWLNDTVPDNCILVSGTEFNFFRSDRLHRKGGGVLIAVRKDIVAVPVAVNSFLECVLVSLKCGPTPYVIGVFYRPPDMTCTFASEFRRVLDDVIIRFPNTVLIIFGDFNFPLIDWSTLSVAGNNAEANEFLNVCLDHSLTQIIDQPTRRSATSANILDLILTNDPDLCSDITHLDGLSDHVIITGNLTRPFNTRQAANKKIRCYNRANFASMNSELLSFSEHFIDRHVSCTIEENWLLFKNFLKKLIEKFIPMITIKSQRTAPLFTQQLRCLSNKKSDSTDGPIKTLLRFLGYVTKPAIKNTRH